MSKYRNRVYTTLLAVLLSVGTTYVNAKTHSVFSLTHSDLIRLEYYEINSGKKYSYYQRAVTNTSELSSDERYRFNACIRLVPVLKTQIEFMSESNKQNRCHEMP